MVNAIDPDIPPSGTGCVECLGSGGWWLHLRRCTECGHIGCCDDSLERHASAHARASGHPVIRSFEPGEDWFWNYQTDKYTEGPRLASLNIILSTNLFLVQLGGFRPTGKSS